MKPQIRSKDHYNNIKKQVELGKFDSKEFDTMKATVVYADLPDEETMIPMGLREKDNG